MENLDLDINNYDLNDILNLFKIPQNFEESHLSQAKKMVLKTHPDKSRLPSKYFLFYSKAYKVLFEIFEFRNKSSNKKKNEEYIEIISGDTEKEQALKVFFDKNKKLKETKNFNKWFNDQFEKNKIQEDSDGYGEWLTSNEDIEPERNISMAQMNEEIYKKKSQIRALIPKKDIEEIYASQSIQGTNLMNNDGPSEFSSDIFSNLPYQDLRQAHVNSVIPVTEEDYHKREKFKNVNEYTTFRNTQDTKPLSERQALDYLEKRGKLENEQATKRAYDLAKQSELAEQKNNDFWSGIFKIKNT